MSNLQCSFVIGIIKDGWFQSGDIVDGTGSHSILATDNDAIIPDESFSVDFGFELGGIVGLSRNGPHTSASQFFITLGKL